MELKLLGLYEQGDGVCFHYETPQGSPVDAWLRKAEGEGVYRLTVDARGLLTLQERREIAEDVAQLLEHAFDYLFPDVRPEDIN